jgi:fatty-acyl-CoA synthase
MDPVRPRVRYATLAQATAEAGVNFPENGFTFQNLNGDETFYSFPEIERQTAKRAAALQAMGLQKGDRLGMIVILPEDFVLTFLAALRIGVVPVPLYPPLYLSSLEDYARQTAGILNSSGATIVVVSAQLLEPLTAFAGQVPAVKQVVGVETLAEATGTPSWPEVTQEDLAFLQYTSGSTADPKGVMVTHRSLVSNILGFMGAGLRMVPGVDKGVSWLPLYHDMGLVGFVLGPVYWGVSVVFIPTMRFVRNPSVWMDTIHRHRGTVSFGPNFAYALVMRKSKPAQLASWDLSSMKAFGCGAEPISSKTLRGFSKLFGENCRLRPSAVLPAYGLAESTLAVTMKPLEDVLATRRVDPSFQDTGVAQEAPEDAPAAEHTSCGTPFPGHELTILGKDGEPLADGVEGEICVSGPSVTAGYFRDPELTSASFKEGRLRTGDLGYLWRGHLYVTGRLKDLIILNGRNVHPQIVEWAVSDVEGVRKGNVVAFSRPGDEGEELVVALETAAKDRQQLVADVDYAVRVSQNVLKVEVVCLDPGTLPKTSSGKVKRHQVRQMYLSNRLR